MHPILHAAVGTKFGPTYVWNEIDTKYLGTQKSKPLVWFLDIDDVFFIWTHGKNKLQKFLNSFKNYQSNI